MASAMEIVRRVVLVQDNHLGTAAADGLQVTAMKFLPDSRGVIHCVHHGVPLVGDQCPRDAKQHHVANGVRSNWPHRKAASGWLMSLLLYTGLSLCWLLSEAGRRSEYQQSYQRKRRFQACASGEYPVHLEPPLLLQFRESMMASVLEAL